MRSVMKFDTFSAEETSELGYKLGTFLRKGDVVCINGALGVGKTAFTGGIAKALGISEYITSPTFTIVNEYQGDIPFYHFDVYRIAEPEEMYQIGFEEYLDLDGIVVIEWAKLIEDILPCNYIEIDIDKCPSEDIFKRVIVISYKGDKYNRLEGLKNEGVGS